MTKITGLGNLVKKIKNLPKMGTFTNLLWICFGLVGGLDYFSREEYVISGIMFLVAVLYGYRLVKGVISAR